jgi:chemotaxis protein methyltransferase CheR
VDAQAEGIVSGPVDAGIELESFLGAILAKYHYDFRGYARVSLKRRLASALSRMGYASLARLQEGVVRDPAEFAKLLDFMTVRVSELFRDPPYFRALREHVVPILRTYPSLKVWVAGCSTGEEVWSFAILLREEGLLERTLIYATDINARALAAAEAGVYAQDRVPLFTENHRLSGGRTSLSAHYTAAYGRVALDRSLRRNVVFSDHSLATDSVFAEVHVVSCRNVLIYFERALQDRAVGLFGDALCRRGYLGLGAGESLRFSAHRDAFEPVVREDRIYQKVAA